MFYNLYEGRKEDRLKYIEGELIVNFFGMIIVILIF